MKNFDLYKTEKPFIIHNLIKDLPISKIKTFSQLKLHFPDVAILTNENYYESIAKKSYQNVVTLGSYVDALLSGEKISHFCSETIVPAEMKQWMPLNQSSLKINTPHIQMMHLGQKIHHAPIHYDSDHRSVLLTQIIGRKRVYLFPANQGKFLYPIKNFSSINFRNFSEKEKKKFVEYVGGYEFTLMPGDTVFIPFCMWHYAEYLDDGFSISSRFTRSPEVKSLSFLPPNQYLQNITRKISQLPTKEKNDYLKTILSRYFAHYTSPYQRFIKTEECLKEIYQKLCSDCPPWDFTSTYFDHTHQWYRKECSKRRVYNPTDPWSKSPEAKIKTQQLSKLKKRLKECSIQVPLWFGLAKSINVNTNIKKLTQLEYSIVMNMLNSQHPSRYLPEGSK